MYKKIPKYRAKPTVADGIRFQSKKEAARYQQLKIIEGANVISNLAVHPAYQITVNDVKICRYIADFTYVDCENLRVVEDVKGYKKGQAYAMFRLKKKLMLAVHGIDVLET